MLFGNKIWKKKEGQIAWDTIIYLVVGLVVLSFVLVYLFGLNEKLGSLIGKIGEFFGSR